MVNTLRQLSRSSGVFLLALSGWAMVHYGNLLRFVPSVVVAVTILILPVAFAYVKLWLRRTSRYIKQRQRESTERDSTFVSAVPDPAPGEALSSIAAAVADEDRRDIQRETFPEGEGLMITYGGFHNSFVRLTDHGRLVVTGASKQTRSLAESIGDLRGVTMERHSNNPLLGPIPVRGAPRWFLGVLLVMILIVGVGVVAGTAYTADTYTIPEKVVLVSYDAHADFAPGATKTDARLGKAEFMVGSLSEEAVEIRWEKNGSSFLVGDGKQALAISDDVRAELHAVKRKSPTDAQAARSDRIESELHTAERQVAESIRIRLRNETTGQYDDELRTIRQRLLSASNQSV